MTGDLDRTLAALADPTRRAIVERLRDGPRQPSELADALALSRPATSRHLRVLRGAGLIVDEALPRDARARVLRLRREPLAAVRAWVDDVERFWGEQLEAFREHAERRAGPPRRRRRR